MTKAGNPTVEWMEIGRSTTSKTENKKRANVQIDNYYVVIGFEVNKPSAFKDKTHDLAEDYGHAFFYIVKNEIVSMIFSFGPDGPGKHGWFNKAEESLLPAPLKNGFNNSRPGTADYHISEHVKAFRINITLKQGIALGKATQKARADIKSGKIRYTAYMNDTCAESARELLSEAKIDNPSGFGWVKHSQMLSFPIAWATNPYMWHHNFIKSGAIELNFRPPVYDWTPTVGEPDPILGVRN